MIRALLLAGCAAVLVAGASPGGSSEHAAISIVAPRDHDLVRALTRSGFRVARHESAGPAIARAKPESALLVLSGGYPERRTPLSATELTAARERGLRLYVEYPEALPGHRFEAPRNTNWERLVISTDRLAPNLPRGRILGLPDCRLLPVTPQPAETWVSAARVAGFDQAVYGLPRESFPILFPANDRMLVSTTCLSRVVRNRCGPQREWEALWSSIVSWLRPGAAPRRVSWSPAVAPPFGPDVPLPRDFERQALSRGVTWVHRSGLLVSEAEAPRLHELLRKGVETEPRSGALGDGDGAHGILEGYASGILHDGSQPVRLPLRADCQAETAMVLAAGGDGRSRRVAGNLLSYLYRTSNLHGGVRGDPTHPAYGLIGWGTIAPAWEVATYGDDEARVLLATAAATVWLKDRRWDEAMLRALAANLRTTGRRGFRGDRIDIPELERRGWKSYREGDLVNLSPSFEAYLWACNLWAYRVTGDPEYLERTRSAIRETMAAYPAGWRWGDNLDRCRMVLPLAWLVRIQDTPEHRGWLARVTDDMLKSQQPNGAIAEQVNARGGGGHFQVPRSNEAYGTGETPLIQRNGDPVSDQLYTGGFALLGLREAVAATGERRWREAEDRLAQYLCRIQIRAPQHPYLDGAWFRAFDFGRWDYWASSADIGWGAWCVESGWAPSWGLATFALRERRTSLWDTLARVPLANHQEAVRAGMSRNDGSPRSPNPG